MELTLDIFKSEEDLNAYIEMIEKAMESTIEKIAVEVELDQGVENEEDTLYADSVCKALVETLPFQNKFSYTVYYWKGNSNGTSGFFPVQKLDESMLVKFRYAKRNEEFSYIFTIESVKLI